MEKHVNKRQQRVAQVVREVLSRAILVELNEFLPTPITLSEVVVSRDLRYATVYYSPLSHDVEIEALTEMLNQFSPSLNKTLGRELTTKYTPKVRFVYDSAFDHAHEMNVLMKVRVQYSDQDDEE